MAAVGVVVGGYLTLEPLVWTSLLTVAVAIFCVCAAGNIFNDIGDVEIDRIAHPDRILVSGRLEVSAARRIGLALTLVGAVLPLFAGLAVVLAVWVMIGLLITYNRYLKRVALAGNLLVATLAASVFMVGGYATSPQVVFELPGPPIAALFAFLMHLMREIAKDTQDMDADRQFGRRTLPILLGERASFIFIAALAVILSLAIYWPYREEWFGRYYMIFAGGGVILPIAVTLTYLFVHMAADKGRILSAVLKVSMGVGLLALLVA
ncbi:MAG: geranylgeranylglycerol-phosphate geranylgeranyltransferase [candidate division Zixibacteria bacterium]|nr:geranylgeranylglycerol-phosphate geranylgeranyltransferase [candidate division Zixibacteria bacterium]